MRRRRGRNVTVVEVAADAAHQQIHSGVAALLTIFLPWVVAFGVVPLAGLAAHLAWGTKPDALPWAVMGLTLGTLTLTALTWHVAHERNLLGRVHLTVNMAAAGVWVTVFTIAGFHRPAVDMWAMGGAFLALAWNVRHGVHGGESADPLGSVWATLTERMGRLEGSTAKTVTAAPHRVDGEVQLVKGSQTVQDLVSARDHIASGFGVASNAVRVTPTADASRPRFTVVRHDLLKAPIAWLGPTAPGRSIIEPVVLGRYEDGELAQLVFPAREQGEQTKPSLHLMVQGMNGAGKSVGARVVLAEVFTRADAVCWAIDIVKCDQTLGCAKAGLDWFATAKPDAKAMLEAIETRIIPARADHLARLGLDNWVPGCGLVYLIVLIEEAAAIVSDIDAFTTVMERARSVGVCIICSLQRASYTKIPTDARAQFGAALCFGVKDTIDAAFALDDLVERGADPSVWKNTRPGYAYLAAPGVDEDRYTVPLRCFHITADEVAQVAAMHARTPLDAVTARAAGTADANRQQDPAGAVRPERQAERWHEGHRVVDGQVIERRDQPSPDDQDDDAMALPDDHEPDLPAGIDDEITEPDNVIEFGLPDVPEASREEATDLLDRVLQTLAAEGREFWPRDLYALLPRVGRGQSWIRGELRRLLAAGVLEQTESGRYRVSERAA